MKTRIWIEVRNKLSKPKKSKSCIFVFLIFNLYYTILYSFKQYYTIYTILTILINIKQYYTILYKFNQYYTIYTILTILNNIIQYYTVLNNLRHALQI